MGTCYFLRIICNMKGWKISEAQDPSKVSQTDIQSFIEKIKKPQPASSRYGYTMHCQKFEHMLQMVTVEEGICCFLAFSLMPHTASLFFLSDSVILI